MASPQPGTPAPTPTAGAPRTARETVELVSSVIAPLTLITALLFYFGWIREGAVFGYFGVDQTTLGFSSTDYLLRSAGTAFRPTAITILATLALLATYTIIGWIVATHAAWRTRVCIASGLLGSLLLGYGTAVLAGWRRVPASPVNAPFALAGGAILAGYSSSLLPAARGVGSTLSLRSRGLFIVLGAVAIFWGTAVYAQSSGTQLAQSIAADLPSRPGIVVWSREDLQVSGPGVNAAKLAQAGSGYKFRYSGLRLLIHARDRFLLLPELWTKASRAPLVVLSDGPTVRVDYLPPG